MELIRYVGLIRRWLWMIIACPIVAALVAAIVSALLPPVYEAKVSLLVRPAQPLTVDTSGAALTSDQISKTYAVLMTEPPLLNRVISDLGLRITPDQLAKQIKVTPQLNTTILDVAVQSTDATAAHEIANALVNDFIQQIRQIQAQESSSPNARTQDSLVVVSPATRPVKPVSPNLPLNVALAFAAGLMVALGLAFLLEYLDQSVQTDDDLIERVGLVPVGHIPFAPASPGRRAELVALASELPVSEAYRSLRTNILFSSVDRQIKTIVLTSPLAGEGKSRTAANLAVVLAEAGFKTLLLDCDFRRPAQHRNFGKVINIGLSNLFLQDHDETELVTPVEQIPNLWLTMSGPTPPNPSELLGSSRMKEFMTRFRAAFAYIVIDTPPVNSVTDAIILASDADATVVVLEQSNTTVPALRHAMQALERVGAHVVGAVVNKAKPLGGEYYTYGYGRGERENAPDGGFNGHPTSVAAGAASLTKPR